MVDKTRPAIISIIFYYFILYKPAASIAFKIVFQNNESIDKANVQTQ